MIIYPLPSPKYVLSNPAYADIWEGLVKALPGLLDVGSQRPETRQGNIKDYFKDKEETKTKEEETKDKDTSKTKTIGASIVPIAFDLETTGLSLRNSGMLCWSWSDGFAHYTQVADPEGVKDLREFYASPVPKVVHNAMMECGWGHHFLGQEMQNLHADTFLLAKREDPNQPAALEDLASLHFPNKYAGYKNDTTDALSEGRAEWVEQGLLLRRNALDSAATMDLFRLFEERMGPEVMALHRAFDLPAANALSKMAHQGLAVDEERLKALGVRCREQMHISGTNLKNMARALPEADWATLAMEVKGDKKMAGAIVRARQDFNPGSPDQIAALLMAFDLDTKEKTKGGKMSTSRDAVLKLDHPLVQELIKYRKWQKVLGDYVEGMPEAISNGIWYPGWYWPITTYRMSASQPIQRIPRRDPETGPAVRSCLGSRFGPEGIVAEFDLGQIELCGQASLSKDETMLRLLREGADLHSFTARLAWGLAPDAPLTPQQRDGGKFVNFAAGYGAGDRRLQATARKDYGLFLPLHEVKRLREGRERAFPQYTAWCLNLRMRIMAGEVVSAPLGGFKYDPKNLLLNMDPHKVALSLANWPIQLSGAWLLLLGLIRAQKVLNNGEAILDATIHDSLRVDCRNIHTFADVAPVVLDCMRQAVESQEWFLVPFRADVKYGHNWAEMEKWEAPC